MCGSAYSHTFSLIPEYIKSESLEQPTISVKEAAKLMFKVKTRGEYQ